MTKTCPICKEKFELIREGRNGAGRTKYCSDYCAKKAHAIKALDYVHRMHSRVAAWDGGHCVRCGIKFKGRKRKYCTKEHARLGLFQGKS